MTSMKALFWAFFLLHAVVCPHIGFAELSPVLQASDDIPLFAAFAALFHAAWIVLISLTCNDIINMPAQCHHQGRQYIATV